MNAFQFLSAQPWVEQLGWTLIHFLWQGALIAAIYAIAKRSRTPQRRYLLACVALAAMVAAPIVTYIAITPASAPANPYVGTIPVSSAGQIPHSRLLQHYPLPHAHSMRT